MQRQVGRMLSRLRPIGLAEFGLREAIENLVAFWRRRRPEIRFEITISPQCKNFGDLLDTTICRVVQGALSNAVRPARPNHIAILIECDRDEVRVAITDDGPGMPEPSRLGYGLVGIKERVVAIGGRTTFSNKSGEGFAVITLLPLTMSAPVSTAKT
jgi:two-component system sensor histidine kinase UhpB